MRYIEVYADYALTSFLTMWINPAERSDPIKKLPKRIFTQELIGATCVHTTTTSKNHPFGATTGEDEH